MNCKTVFVQTSLQIVDQTLDINASLSSGHNTVCVSFCSHLLMSGCWAEDPNERPAFSNLVPSISDRLKSLAGYLDLSPTWSSGDK